MIWKKGMNMIHKNNSQIQWGTNVRSYMFGSQIEHHPDGSVNFSNPLIASGTEIHSWLAIQNYQASRKQPSLPLLKRDIFIVSNHNLQQFLKVRFILN